MNRINQTRDIGTTREDTAILRSLKQGFIPHTHTHTRARPRSFTVIFYGVKTFPRKTAQLCVTRRECRPTELPSVGDAVQRSENVRKIG
jgi:hypothetical protein